MSARRVRREVKDVLENAEQFGEPVEVIPAVVNDVVVLFKLHEQPPNRRTVTGVGHAAVIDRNRAAQPLIDERRAVQLSRALINAP